VIGGGHNGLVAAAYLARAGARVVVCEARHKTGGAAATDQPWPDHPEFRVTTLSYVMSLMPNAIVRDLRLARHGYRVHPVGPFVVPFPDGRVMIEYDDPSKNHDEFAKFSTYSFTFSTASWYRRSPYWQRTIEAGCTSWDLYNHMLIPTLYDDDEQRYCPSWIRTRRSPRVDRAG